MAFKVLTEAKRSAFDAFVTFLYGVLSTEPLFPWLDGRDREPLRPAGRA
jgi:hypothetical protein